QTLKDILICLNIPTDKGQFTLAWRNISSAKQVTPAFNCEDGHSNRHWVQVGLMSIRTDVHCCSHRRNWLSTVLAKLRSFNLSLQLNLLRQLHSTFVKNKYPMNYTICTQNLR